MTTSKVAWIGIGGLAVLCGLGAHALTIGVNHPPSSMNVIADRSTKHHEAAPAPCGAVNPIVGHVGLLKPGVSPNDVMKLGTTVRATVVENPQTPGSHGDTLVVLGEPPRGTIASNVLAVLNANGVVYALSSDPRLMSCWYQLSDSPGALRYVRIAKNAALAAGLATSLDLDSDASIYLVSDDPTRSDRVIVTLDIRGPGSPGVGAGPAVYSLRSIIVLVSKSTGSATGIGPGTW